MAETSNDARLETMIDRFDLAIAEILRGSLSRMRTTLPNAVEMVYDKANSLVVGFCPTDRPSEAVFSIVAYPRSVSLCFLQAFRMPSFPDSPLLRGGGRVVRHVFLSSAGDLDRVEVRELMEEALAFAAKPFDETRARRIEIRKAMGVDSPHRR